MKLQRRKSTPKQEQDFKLLLDSVEADLSHTLNRLRQEHADDRLFSEWGLMTATLNHVRRAALAMDEPELVSLLQPALAFSFLRLCGDNRREAMAGLLDALAKMQDDGLPAQNAPSSPHVQ